MSPKTTPMLPSVRAQKPDAAVVSWPSVVVMLAVMGSGERFFSGFDPAPLTRHERLSTKSSIAGSHVPAVTPRLLSTPGDEIPSGRMVAQVIRASDWAAAAGLRASR